MKKTNHLSASAPCAIGLAVWLAHVSMSAQAQVQTPAPSEEGFSLLASAGILNDDNIYRLQSDTRSDQVRFVTLGLRFDHLYSQQRIIVNANVTDNRHRDYSNLNFVSKNYLAEWQWYLTSSLTGRLSADRAEALLDFRDYGGGTSRTEKNIVTTENRRFNADWWMQGGWHLVGGAVETRQTYSLHSETAVSTNRLRSGEAGVRYVTESNNSLTVLRRQGSGEYPGRAVDLVNSFDNRFKQDETEATLQYLLSGKSTLTGRVARLTRKHDNVPVRDYSGTSGLLEWRWNSTAQFNLNMGAARDLVSFQDQTASYYVDNRMYVAPTWTLSTKTSLGLRYQESRRNFKGTLTTAANTREDKVRNAGVSLTWAPVRNYSVVTSWQQEKLTSNETRFEYKDNLVSVLLSAVF